MPKGKKKTASNSAEIKNRFGTLFRAARDRLKVSRATLAHKLGVSPKTVQSWEMGRTFVEDLSLVPLIESELNISFQEIIEVALNNDRDSSMANASERIDAGGFQKLNISLYQPDTLDLDSDAISPAYRAIPEVSPEALETKVSQLQHTQIMGYIPVPDAWCPRGGVLVASRIHDKNMDVMFPDNTILILDLRSFPLSKYVGHTVIMKRADKTRPLIRLITNDLVTGKYYGACAGHSQKGLVPFNTEGGDRVLGRVVGFMAKPSVQDPRF